MADDELTDAERRALERVPYVFEHVSEDALEPLERALIVAGLIEAIGLRFVGSPRSGVAP